MPKLHVPILNFPLSLSLSPYLFFDRHNIDFFSFQWRIWEGAWRFHINQWIMFWFDAFNEIWWFFFVPNLFVIFSSEASNLIYHHCYNPFNAPSPGLCPRYRHTHIFFALFLLYKYQIHIKWNIFLIF